MPGEAEPRSEPMPKLRFPEFRDAPGWELWPLKKVAKRRTRKNIGGNVDRVLTNSAEHGVVDQRDYFEKDIANPGNLQGYFIVEKGDYVYNPRISSLAPVGPIHKNDIGLGVMSPLYTIFAFDSPNNDFYAHYFMTSHWHNYLRQVSNSGARHDRMAISAGDFIDLPVPVSDPLEQQKIADCLSSIDALIAAEADKLEALKEHKCGLMQQLFPSSGETTPRLRFVNFHEAGDWKEKRLSDIGRVQMCKRIFKEQTGPLPGVPFYKIGTFGGVADAYISNEIYVKYRTEYSFPRKGNVLISAAGTIGRVIVYDGKPGYFQDSNIVWLENDNKTIKDNFLFYLLQLIDWKANIGAINRLYNNDILETCVTFPSLLEQQKIAACLIALDNLISAQGDKIKGLRTHKIGLMQQLFPTANEVTG